MNDYITNNSISNIMLSTFPKAFASYYNGLFTSKNKNDFICTDCYFTGEEIKSKSNNQYFRIVDKNEKISNLNNFNYYFPLHHIMETSDKLNFKFDPNKHMLIRLEFTKNKKYFIESNQCISVMNFSHINDNNKPDVTVLNIPFEEIIETTPKFVPFPDVIGQYH